MGKFLLAWLIVNAIVLCILYLHPRKEQNGC
jgi:hypothetical protein